MIQSVNERPVKCVADLLSLRDAAAGRPLSVGIVRGQQPQTLRVESYVHCVAETVADRDFRILPLASASDVVAIKRIATRPDTRNEPPAVLHDGQIAENYGPVFGNDVIGGEYKVDLGATIEVAEVNTWSYHQDGKRGAQRFVLFGSTAAEDPGWNARDATKFTPIAEADTTSLAMRRFLATSVRRGDGRPLGAFRWLVWVVHPVTGIDENTAYQEFQIRRFRGSPR